MLTPARATDQPWGWQQRLFLQWWRRLGSGSRVLTHPSCFGSTSWMPKQRPQIITEACKNTTNMIFNNTSHRHITTITISAYILGVQVQCRVPCLVPVVEGCPPPPGLSGLSAQLACWCWWFPSELVVLSSAHKDKNMSPYTANIRLILKFTS